MAFHKSPKLKLCFKQTKTFEGKKDETHRGTGKCYETKEVKGKYRKTVAKVKTNHTLTVWVFFYGVIKCDSLGCAADSEPSHRNIL